jgi:hypothetical protein
MKAYQKFTPLMVECEYLYETLLLFANFNYQFVNVYSSNQLPILIEGIPTIEGQPRIEAMIAQVSYGERGRQCEEMLSYTQANEDVPF